MDNDIIDRVWGKYGVIGLFLVCVSALVLFSAWLVAVGLWIWPAALPVLAVLWMVWRTRKENKDD